MKTQTNSNKKALQIKKTIALKTITFICLAIGIEANAQDPFVKLKQAAQTRTEDKAELSKVTVNAGSPYWKAVVKTPIVYKPFPMKDKDGKAIPPTEIITLANGVKMTNQEYINQVNDAEKKLNADGYSLRNTGEVVVSQIATNVQDFDGKVNSQPKPIGPVREQANLNAFMNTNKKIGTASLKPVETYTATEKSEIDKYTFITRGDEALAVIDDNPVAKTAPLSVGLMPLKTIDETTTKDWNLGNASSFQVGITGTLTRHAKIYHFNPQNPGNNLSEYKVAASAKVYGAILSHTLDIFIANAEVFAPSDISKKMTAKIMIKVGNTVILNLNQNYAQAANFTDNNAQHYERSIPAEISIVSFLKVSAKIGVTGDAGLSYRVGIYRTLANLQATPIVNIAGYAEGGVSVVGIFKIGAGGNLTFIKGNLDLQAYVGLWNQNANQIIVGYNYYVGYDLTILKGDLYIYAQACLPWFLGGGCATYRHIIFSWSGYTSSGTIAEGSKTFVLANL